MEEVASGQAVAHGQGILLDVRDSRALHYQGRKTMETPRFALLESLHPAGEAKQALGCCSQPCLCSFVAWLFIS